MTSTSNRIGAGRAMLLAGAAAIAFAAGAQAQGMTGGTPTQPLLPGATAGASTGTGTGSGAAAGMADQLRAVERSLRESGEQLGAAQAGQAPNFGQARTAVQAGQAVLGRLPQDHQGAEGFRTAQRELGEAQEALAGDQPDRQRAAAQLREAAESFATLTRGMGGSTAAAATGQTMAMTQGQTQVEVQQRAPQINVQQQQPQITVNQPPPQITINQPPPQVTITQPEPRVTVQQAQPQVTVQQAQPQVNVQTPGQPQVNVQQAGQPQVRMEGQDRQAQAGTQTRSIQGQAPAVADAQAGTGGAANVQRTTTSPGAAMSRDDAQRLIGTNVVGRNGRDAGEVRNLVLDASGQVRGAVVEWGGFLGLGTREAIVPLDRIAMQGANGRAQLNMTREELEAMPRFESARLAEQGRTHGWGDNLRLAR